MKKAALKPYISERDKSIIVALSKSGVASTTIAEAFGIPRQQVAAYRAWDTMRATN